jgi:hypothetical protein
VGLTDVAMGFAGKELDSGIKKKKELDDNLGCWFNLWSDLGRGGKVEEVIRRKLGFTRRRVTQRYLQSHYSASLHGPMSCLSAFTISFFSHYPYEGQLKHLFT